ncbi:MAG: hypothetical protein ACERKX_05200 [Anaerolineales bacterium]
MDRTVPRTGSEEIELYIRTYYSLLRSTTDVRIRTLEEVHANMGSSLHAGARATLPDTSALIYSSLRLPPQIVKVERIVLGQGPTTFKRRGFSQVETWEPANAVARRRRSFFDGVNTLACYIASRSDIDDMVPLLTAYQIEWNKLHRMMQGEQVREFLNDPVESEEGVIFLAHGIGIDQEELERLLIIWGEDFWTIMQRISEKPKDFRVQLLGGTLSEYRRATENWWGEIERNLPSILERPVYFVSGNAHSIVNLLSGFALRHESLLLDFIRQPECGELLDEWRDIESRQVPSNRENFLYYTLKKYLTTPEGQELVSARREAEGKAGISRVQSVHAFDVEAQLIEVKNIHHEYMDPRLRQSDLKKLAKSDAVVLNIDYPLGEAAYLILSHLASRVGELRGVYIMGKAATLNGVIGDVAIPAVVHDEQSQNTYLFDNCFSAIDVRDHLVYGTVLDNQKAVSVQGTFLQTPRYMDVFYREGYTDIEMESGPYLSAVYETHRPKRYPNNEIVDMHGLSFDLGILHYASDTPLSEGKNLGAGSLSYFGMDPTYAISIAILRRILQLESTRTE